MMDMDREREEGTRAVSGILLALVLGVIFWGLIIAWWVAVR